MVIRMSSNVQESLEESTKNLSVASPPSALTASTSSTTSPASSTSSSSSPLRRVRKCELRNTKAEFKRLKTIVPAIQRKDHVSRLDIILEAIKYIDDLQDQLIDRLSGPKLEREQALAKLTERDMEERLLKGFMTVSTAEEGEEEWSDLSEEDEGVRELRGFSSDMEDDEVSIECLSPSSTS